MEGWEQVLTEAYAGIPDDLGCLEYLTRPHLRWGKH